LSKVIPEACGVVWQAVKAAQVKGAGRHIAVYRPGGDGRFDVEIGVELDTPFPGAGHGDVVASTTPAGGVAALTHVGPYAGLAATHQALQQWCADKSLAPAGVSWELYDHWKDEWNTDPSKIRTDVFYLLKS
jgi:effector-binding domain-containing protein